MADPTRITNCQRAAVCGLMIAGLTFTQACEIANVARFHVKATLPTGWAARRRPGRTNKVWKGEKLERLRLAYLDRSLEGKDIARRFDIDVSYLYRLAVVHGWPRRVKRRYPKPTLSPAQRKLFNKFIRHGVPRVEALAEACR